MKLKHYIEQQHNGNVSAFARENNMSIVQANRYIKYECIIINGVIYKPVKR